MLMPKSLIISLLVVDINEIQNMWMKKSATYPQWKGRFKPIGQQQTLNTKSRINKSNFLKIGQTNETNYIF